MPLIYVSEAWFEAKRRAGRKSWEARKAMWGEEGALAQIRAAAKLGGRPTFEESIKKAWAQHHQRQK